jgi:hypothetical protein
MGRAVIGVLRLRQFPDYLVRSLIEKEGKFEVRPSE